MTVGKHDNGTGLNDVGHGPILGKTDRAGFFDLAILRHSVGGEPKAR